MSSQPVNLSNPHDPRAKEFLRELQNALVQSVAEDVAMYKALRIEVIKDREVRKREAKERADKKQHSEMLEIEQKIRDADNQSDQETRFRQMEEVKKQIDEYLDRLRSQRQTIEKTIQQAHAAINQVSVGWNERHIQANEKIVSEYAKEMHDQQLSIKDKNGTALSPDDFYKVLNDCTVKDIAEVFKKQKMDERIAYISDRPSDIKVKIEHQHQMLAQYVNTSNVIQQLKIIFKLNNIDEETVPDPAEILATLKANKQLSKLLTKLNAATYNDDVESLHTLSEQLTRVEEYVKKLNKTDVDFKKLEKLSKEINHKVEDLSAGKSVNSRRLGS